MHFMEIPYAIKPREDTGTNNAHVGIWLFLSSEIIFFGALFSSYVVLRASSNSWPIQYQEMNVPVGTINTAILIISSVTILQAWISLKAGNLKKFRTYLIITICLGLLFSCLKIFLEWVPDIHRGNFFSTNNFFALYFTMTGIHLLHLFGGITVNTYHLFTAKKIWDIEPERMINRIEVTALYWHFVDLVWIFLFPTLYLL